MCELIFYYCQLDSWPVNTLTACPRSLGYKNPNRWYWYQAISDFSEISTSIDKFPNNIHILVLKYSDFYWKRPMHLCHCHVLVANFKKVKNVAKVFFHHFFPCRLWCGDFFIAQMVQMYCLQNKLCSSLFYFNTSLGFFECYPCLQSWKGLLGSLLKLLGLVLYIICFCTCLLVM